MQPALVREGAVADVGLPLVRLNVRQLVEKLRHLAELFELRRAHAFLAHLQLQVGDHGDQIDVAAALAEAVDRALHLGRAHLHRGQRVGNRQFAVVVAVNAQRRLDHPVHLREGIANIDCGNRPPLVSQRTIQSAPPSCAALRHSSA